MIRYVDVLADIVLLHKEARLNGTLHSLAREHAQEEPARLVQFRRGGVFVRIDLDGFPPIVPQPLIPFEGFLRGHQFDFSLISLLNALVNDRVVYLEIGSRPVCFLGIDACQQRGFTDLRMEGAQISHWCPFSRLAELRQIQVRPIASRALFSYQSPFAQRARQRIY